MQSANSFTFGVPCGSTPMEVDQGLRLDEQVEKDVSGSTVVLSVAGHVH